MVSSQLVGHAEGEEPLGEQLAVGRAPLVELEGDLVVVVVRTVEVLQPGELHPARLVVLVTAWRPHTHRRQPRTLPGRRPSRPGGALGFAHMTEKQRPDRNLALELVRTTEAAALAASRWMGRGDKNGADGAAVDAMRVVLDTVPMDGIVIIGEGEKDEAPMLFNGERIGDGTPMLTDIAVDPIDGTTLTSLGRGGAIAVIAVSERGTMFDPGPVRLHGEDRGRPRVRRRHRPEHVGHREPAGGGQGQGRERARRHRGHPRPPPPRGDHRRGAGGGRAHPPHPRRRRGRRHLHGLGRLRRRHPARHRRHARRA